MCYKTYKFHHFFKAELLRTKCPDTHKLYINDLMCFSNPSVKTKKFLTFTQSHNSVFQITLFLTLCLCARIFRCGKISRNIITTQGLSPHFNSSICCQLVLSVRPQHYLVNNCLQAYLFWMKQYQQLSINKKQVYYFFVVFWLT